MVEKKHWNLTKFPSFYSIIDPPTTGRPQGQGPLRHTRVAEALDTGMEKVEVITIEPQAILPNSINLGMVSNNN